MRHGSGRTASSSGSTWVSGGRRPTVLAGPPTAGSRWDPAPPADLLEVTGYEVIGRS